MATKIADAGLFGALLGTLVDDRLSLPESVDAVKYRGNQPLGTLMPHQRRLLLGTLVDDRLSLPESVDAVKYRENHPAPTIPRNRLHLAVSASSPHRKSPTPQSLPINIHQCYSTFAVYIDLSEWNIDLLAPAGI